MNENKKMGGFNPEELKEALQGVADEYSEGVWALEYIAQLEAEIERLREALLDVINQACQVEITAKQECIISNLALSSYEDAIDLLEESGLVERLPGKLMRWKIKWEVLGGER